MNSEHIGNLILTLREETGITQKDLAKKIGVPTKLVGMWESGVCYPSADKISELSSVLNVQVAELLLGKRLATDEKQVYTETEQVLSIYSEIATSQLKVETKYRRLQLTVVTILAITLGIFLIDSFPLILFLTVIFPILATICFVSSIVFYSTFRHTNKISNLPIVVGIISFLIVTSILSLFIFAFWIGGPVPT